MQAPAPILSRSIQCIKGVGPKLSQTLSKKGIRTVEDALYFLPRTYEDRRALCPIARLVSGQTATIYGEVTQARNVLNRKGKSFEVVLSDKTGSIKLFWFKAARYLEQEFQPGKRYIARGEARFFAGSAQIVHPEYEAITQTDEDGRPKVSANFGRIVPIYSETEGLYQKAVRRVMGEVLKTSLSELEDPLPDPLLHKLKMPSLRKSFVSVHFPTEMPNDQSSGRSIAHKRIIFDEFFTLQLGLGLRKQQRKKDKAPAFHKHPDWLASFLKSLPFELTVDQQKALKAIATDLSQPVPMTRLLQGDVGAGKTVVALAAAGIVAQEGYQTALMAPTEILAQQHFKTAEQWLQPLGISVSLITHSTSPSKILRYLISSGEAKVVIGTHAVFQKDIHFDKLGLVIVDEQHRFGVEQRTQLIRKAQAHTPHVLMMTATPIPRTLSLTLYGDLDLSLIRTKPKGRQPIRTKILYGRNRAPLNQAIRQRVEKGEQVYVIYPLVEASEKLELKSATEMYERLSKEDFPDYRLALLHGRLKGEQKDQILADFKAGKHQILVSTTVIEVGIDVPNATLMVIEHPERLGLSQLHQLRGRVGRGSSASECLLVAEKFVTERLKIMTATEDGFVIAEEDLRIRGPGEFLGTRQSGLPGFRVGDLFRDAELLELAQTEAQRILTLDPQLQLPEHERIRKTVENRWKEKIERLRGT